MGSEAKFLVDVGMRDLPFPMRVISKKDPGGQPTVADISITARIMQSFEARWIDSFTQIVHEHRDRIGTETLRTNVQDYIRELNATSVTIDFAYPYFAEKLTPVSGETCLVKYNCNYSVKAPTLTGPPKVTFHIEVPCITTYPASSAATPGGLFGQLSVLRIGTESEKEVYVEDLVDIVDRHALSPVYSFLGEDDQAAIIQKVHSEERTSVEVTDKVKSDLAHRSGMTWYSVRCANYGMLHSYSTMVGTEKSSWVPYSGEADEI